jgi:hypothetical protein
MNRTLVAALSILLFPALGTFAEVAPTVIYGADDRLDLYQVKIQKIKQLADSTVALFEAGDVGAEGKLVTSPYGEGLALCKEEPYWSQKTGAFCSGSLVGPDLIMTAGHCVTDDAACKNIKFVFGFAVKKEGVLPEKVNPSDVYSCAKVIARAQEDAGADYALVQLDRKVANHKTLEIDRAGALANGDALYVIGHPSGLPTKVAGGATVRDASPAAHFVANLDTYGGNSGSAVFNAKTGLVVGILVRGENDYVTKDGCKISNKCPDTGCRGEDVTKVSALASMIPVKGKVSIKKNGAAMRQLVPLAGPEDGAK